MVIQFIDDDGSTDYIEITHGAKRLLQPTHIWILLLCPLPNIHANTPP